MVQKFSIPYTGQQEVIGVDNNGTATLCIVQQIKLDSFKSEGRDKATIENVKQALKTLYLKSGGPFVIKQKSNAAVEEKTQEETFGALITLLLPDKPMKVGEVYKMKVSSGFPIEREWTFKELKLENNTSLALLQVRHGLEVSVPFEDIFKKIKTENSNEITFNLDRAIVEKQEILKDIEVDLVDSQRMLLGGRARTHTIVKVTEWLEN